ncbi:MAG TPA: CusA/CzcA family heavy metal efflux RND transporter [Polyangiaceae bacterium]|nr:CusA/CzcA family heavy metal efflux RND transporter [Polyangiaceae bacterium]
MLERLLKFALDNRLAPFVLALVLAGWGLYAYRNLTIEAFPDPTDTQVQLITLFPGQPTEEVERRVSLPLERALNGTPGLSRLRSISLFGLSFVTLTFEDGVDPLIARQQTLERTASAELPEGVQPSLGPMATPIGEIYRYTLEGKNADPMTLRTLQEWVVRPRLLQAAGVADVVTYGGLVQEVHVQPDPARMADLSIGLQDIFEALHKASSNATGGYIERGSEMFVIRSLGIFKNVPDLERVRVGFHDGVPVTIRDVASVSVGYAPRQGIVTREQNEDAVEGIVLMRRGQNPSVVLENLKARIADLNQRALPDGIRLKAFYDRTELVNTTIKTVFRNLAEGAVLVILVLLAFMLSLRAALIVAITIPLSLAASFAYLHTRGMSANLLSMGAVDFGIIVDGAVILVEHLFHKLSPSHPNLGHANPGALDFGDEGVVEAAQPLKARLFHAAREVAKPTLFSLLIIIAAYLPIFSLQRVEGRIFSPLANTVVSALLGALLMTFTLVPVLCLIALRKAKPTRDSPLLTLAQRVFDPSLRFAMNNVSAVLLLATFSLVSAFALLPRLGSEFLPALNEGALYVTFTLPDNLSLTEGRKLAPRLREILHRTPEAVELLSQLGRPEDGTDPTLPSNLEIFVKLKPLEQWRKNIHSLDDIIQEMAKNLQEVPGIEYNFSQPIRDNVAENISGQFGQIALKIYGDDLKELQEAADKATAVLNTVPGAADVGVVKSGETPQIAVRLDRNALSRFNLDLGDVQDYIETAMGGHVASELWDGERRFDVTVRLPPATREDANSIRRLMLPMHMSADQRGQLIPLSAVAQVSMATGRAAITRENGRRYVGVRMNVRNRDLGSFVEEARQKFAEKVRLPAGYEVSWGGEFENQQRAMQRLRLVIPLALLITFLLLFSAFGSLFDAVLILLNVPFALIGGVIGLAWAGMPLSVSAAVGFIALLGQAVLNGVLVVASIRSHVMAGEPLREAAINGTRERLRAVLVTAFLASLGLLPAAMSHAIGSETQRPIAVVVVGGTISAALLTLIVLPVTFYVGSLLVEAFRRPKLVEAGA